MRIAIVGGHGKVALHLHPILAAAGHIPLALVRSESYRAELEGLGAEVGLLDIENQDADAFAAAFAGCDAVVFTAGGGPDGNKERKRTVDLEGATKSIAGAEAAGIKRFVQVSAISVDEPVPADAGEVWTAYVEAKRDADIALRDSDLEWTILRPGGLTDEPATGRVKLAPKLERDTIPRADVAAVIAAVIDDPATVGKQWELVSGDLSVDEAIAAVL
ncbi:SDR family oxidoreductase [Nocardioides sp. KC13]|uniref:SDR family oxidoreductase n=1 Tax=Nocardioides turkmenicus TaxID=2711220 RepID=A0A6M1R0D6_9ACTN|nr:SDR family oxidoreductase [Nocardioides sp. KC13]NGN93142.1 SDR family oxidoreductase [Nocardioides sp. KC13]